MDLFRVVIVLLLLYIRKSFSAILAPIVTTLERATTTCDGETVIYCNCSVSKFNRTSPYMLNMYAFFEKPLTRDFTTTMKSYEWKDNQYKESFIRFEKNLCDFIETDQLMKVLSKNFAAFPKKCPFKVGEFTLKNFWIKPGVIPFGFPLSKWKLQFVTKHTVLNKVVGSFEIEFRVEQLAGRKGRSK